MLASAAQAAGAEPITQGEWAVYLARGLGLEKEMPPGSSTDKYISILGNKGYRRIEGEDFHEASSSLGKEESTEFGSTSRKQWLRAGEESGTVRYKFEVPVHRRYTIRARSRGGSQFWTVDDRGSVMLSPDDTFEWKEVGEFNFKPGEHEVTVSIPPGGGLDLFELLTENASAIEPPGGFQPLTPLTYGDKAATIVKALNLEDELPIDGGFFLIIEAELYDRAEGQFQVSKDQQPGSPSAARWVKSEGEVTASYSYEVPERGLYSIQARGFGSRKEEWMFDLGVEKVTFVPISPQQFNWDPVTTIFLEAGPHMIDVTLKEGNGTDVIMILRRRSSAGDYLQLLSDLGLQEGALPAKKKPSGQRRYQPYQTMEAEKYRETIKGDVIKDTTDRYGVPSDLSWIRPKGDSVVCRYEVELREDGMYALYMRSFGPNFTTWTIDPGEDTFRERRDSFPLLADEFAWREVVTLELARGKHIFDVTVPDLDGLDNFELRKRAWSQADLDRLAREAVSREEALRNLEEVEERGEGPGEEKEEEVEPEPPDETEPPEEYTPLSPYIPGA